MKYLTTLLILASIGVLDANPWYEPNCVGNRRTIVHLFEWKWSDIALECERFLGPRGFCGVQTSPPMDHLELREGETTEPIQPWWQRYQPVGYNLDSRSGSEAEFFDMVNRCNAVDVRIYADAVINHMSGVGREGIGIGGSPFNATDGLNASFPAAGYESTDFHDCSSCDGCCCVNAYTDFANVRNCRLSGLIDLNPKVQHSLDITIGLLNKMVDGGVAGFRVDAAKHMWEEDVEAIMNGVHNLPTELGFPAGSKAFLYQEVIDLNQYNEVTVHMYKHLGLVTEFRFCSKISDATSYLGNIKWLWDAAWGMVEPEYAFVFVDNHDNQRGHGGGGDVITHKDGDFYSKAVSITLAQQYGYQRIMSSYDFGDDTEAGPPHNPDWSTEDVVINPDGSCAGDWVCEHRWPAIAGMVGWAKATHGTNYSDSTIYDNWVEEGNKVAFSRGGKGFVAFSNEGNWITTLQTGLPAGDYCNVITGCATSSGCEGQTITVNGDGTASISLDYGEPAVLAIHVEATSGSDNCAGTGYTTTSPGPTTTPLSTTAPPSTTAGPTTTPGPTTTAGPTTSPPPTTTQEPTTGPPGFQTTIVYLEIETMPGQDIFIRGGLDETLVEGCSPDLTTSPCAVDIQTSDLGQVPHYDGYNAWRVGDLHLDWYGAQSGQGSNGGVVADGTPCVWTTSNTTHPGYQPDNPGLPHYWKVEFLMNCDETLDGWFELKGFMKGGSGWESDITQETCTGDVGGTPPFTTLNHIARCGYRNVFSWGSGTCVVETV